MFVGSWKELVRTSMAMCERTSLSIRQNQFTVHVAMHQGRDRVRLFLNARSFRGVRHKELTSYGPVYDGKPLSRQVHHKDRFNTI